MVSRHALGEFVSPYFDDINLFSMSFQDHLLHLERFLGAVMAVGFKLSITKSVIAAPRDQSNGEHGIVPGNDTGAVRRCGPAVNAGPDLKIRVEKLLGHGEPLPPLHSQVCRAGSTFVEADF